MTDPPKASSRPNYRGGEKIQVYCYLLKMDNKMSCVLTRVLKIIPDNTSYTASRRAASMQQRALEASVASSLDLSNFPPLPGAKVIPEAIRSQVQCPSST